MDTNTSSLPVARKKLFNVTISGQPDRVSFDYDPILPSSKILSLYQTIKNALPGQTSYIVQFASAYNAEGTNLIAFETALAAATQIGLRVLFIDTAHQKKQLHTLSLHVDTTLDSLLQQGGQLERSQIGVEETKFVYTRLRNLQMKDSALAQMENLNELLTIMRGMYDLIVIPSPAILTDILCASLAKLADGTIMVIEAERTRAPVAAQVKETITHHGGKVIGAIMNKRRYYIPRLMYRWI